MTTIPLLDYRIHACSWTYPKNAVVQYSPRDSEDVDTDSSRIHEFILLHLDNLEVTPTLPTHSLITQCVSSLSLSRVVSSTAEPHHEHLH